MVNTIEWSGSWGGYLHFGLTDGNYPAWSPEGAWLSWDSYWLKRAANNSIGKTARLAFRFEPTSGYDTLGVLDYNKFDRTLELMNGVGVKVIADLHENGDYCLDARFLQQWVGFAQHYKGDSRIAALGLFNEPKNVPLQDCMNYYAHIAREIWKVDPNRLVIMPMTTLIDSTGAQQVAAIKATGIDKDARCYFDIEHPYLFESDYDNVNPDGSRANPQEKLNWYIGRYMKPYLDAFGGARCWIGETYYLKDGTPALQTEWLKLIVNWAFSNGVGIMPVTLWGDGSTVAAEDNALAGIVPPKPPKPPVTSGGIGLILALVGLFGIGYLINKKK